MAELEMNLCDLLCEEMPQTSVSFVVVVVLYVTAPKFSMNSDKTEVV